MNNAYNLPDSLLSAVSGVISGKAFNNAFLAESIESKYGTLEVSVLKEGSTYIAVSNLGFTKELVEKAKTINKSTTDYTISLTEEQWKSIL